MVKITAKKLRIKFELDKLGPDVRTGRKSKKKTKIEMINAAARPCVVTLAIYQCHQIGETYFIISGGRKFRTHHVISHVTTRYHSVAGISRKKLILTGLNVKYSRIFGLMGSQFR